MEFGPSRAQEMLRRSAAELLGQRADVERVREIMATETAVDGDLVGALAEQGLLGLLIGEEHGGSGLGLFEAALVAQEIGRVAAPVDFAASAVEGPLLLRAALDGGSGDAPDWLARVAAGEVVLAPVHGLDAVDGVPVGTADHVAGVAQATHLLAPGPDGRCRLVPVDADGVERTLLTTIDETRRWARVRLEDVAAADVVELPRCVDEATLRRVEEAAMIVTAADSLGACYRAIALAVDYARQREQFGRVIGSFQAVKHLCAEMIADVDPVQSLLWYAAYAWDQQQDDAAFVAPLLAAHAAEVGYDCVTRATQVFGGIGFTWDCDLHLFFKRVQVDRQLRGRPEELRERAARAQGL